MFGDSWPAGEWAAGSEDIQHKGIQHYFIEHGFDCLNLCYPGGSNLQSVKRVDNFFLTGNCKDSDILIFWMTEFFREIWYHNDLEPQNQLKEQLKLNYTKLRDAWIHRPYYRLQDLCEKYNKTIYLLGGASDTVNYPDFNQDYPNLKILCQSITNLILNDQHTIEDPVYCEYLNGWVDPFLSLIKKSNMTNKDLSEFLNDIQKGNDRVKLFSKNKNWFYPDGIHPNRHAHKKLFDFLIKNFDVFG